MDELNLNSIFWQDRRRLQESKYKFIT